MTKRKGFLRKVSRKVAEETWGRDATSCTASTLPRQSEAGVQGWRTGPSSSVKSILGGARFPAIFYFGVGPALLITFLCQMLRSCGYEVCGVSSQLRNGYADSRPDGSWHTKHDSVFRRHGPWANVYEREFREFNCKATQVRKVCKAYWEGGEGVPEVASMPTAMIGSMLLASFPTAFVAHTLKKLLGEARVEKMPYGLVYLWHLYTFYSWFRWRPGGISYK